MLLKTHRLYRNLMLGLCLLQQLPAETLAGTIYSHHAGTSGTGVGDLKLETRSTLFELTFQKPISGQLKFPACSELGSYWFISAVLRGTTGHVQSASCKGNHDEVVFSAWKTAVLLLNLASAGDLMQARSLMMKRRQQERYSNDLNIEDLDFSSYHPTPNASNCLEVYSKEGSRHVVLTAPDFCNIYFHAVPLTIRVSMVKKAGHWRVERLIRFNL